MIITTRGFVELCAHLSIYVRFDKLVTYTETPFELLADLSPRNARWVLSRLLAPENAVVWAEAAARRAKGHAAKVNSPGFGDAARAAAARATRYARYTRCADYASAAVVTDGVDGRAAHDRVERAACSAVSWAASAAVVAAAADCAITASAFTGCAARYTTARHAEHHTAIRHALLLIGEQ